MSTMSNGSNRPAIAEMIGHYTDPLWAPAMVASGVTSAVIPVGSTLGWAFSLVYVAVIFGAVACNVFAHGGTRLCERCVRADPLDPQAAVERDRIWLKIFHRVSRHVVLHIRSTHVPLPTSFFALLLFCLAAQLAIRLIFDPGKQAMAFVSLLTVTIPLASVLWATHRHNRLKPWCPFCRRDDGGDEVEAPEPDPSISR